MVELVALGLAALDALCRQVERVEEAPETGIGGQRADQRLRLHHLIGEALHLLLGEEQHAVLAEELAAVGPHHAVEQLRVGLELLGERGRGILGLIRRRAVDHNHDQVA